MSPESRRLRFASRAHLAPQIDGHGAESRAVVEPAGNGNGAARLVVVGAFAWRYPPVDEGVAGDRRIVVALGHTHGNPPSHEGNRLAQRLQVVRYLVLPLAPG